MIKKRIMKHTKFELNQKFIINRNGVSTNYLEADIKTDRVKISKFTIHRASFTKAVKNKRSRTLVMIG